MSTQNSNFLRKARKLGTSSLDQEMRSAWLSLRRNLDAADWINRLAVSEEAADLKKYLKMLRSYLVR